MANFERRYSMLSSIKMVARKHYERLYTDTCIIKEQRKAIKDPKTGIITNGEIESISYPCRISFKTISSNDIVNKLPAASQVITLFTSPEINIKPGSDIEVVRQGRTFSYTAASQTALYDTHQEIELKLRSKHNG